MMRDSPAPRGHFPRPNMTLRELIGLVVAFAVSNAFLSWFNPPRGRPRTLSFFSFWNGMLSFYLGFAFPPGMASIDRAMASDGAMPSPPGRYPPRWTAAWRRGGDGHRRDRGLLLGDHAGKDVPLKVKGRLE